MGVGVVSFCLVEDAGGERGMERGATDTWKSRQRTICSFLLGTPYKVQVTPNPMQLGFIFRGLLGSIGPCPGVIGGSSVLG